MEGWRRDGGRKRRKEREMRDRGGRDGGGGKPGVGGIILSPGKSGERHSSPAEVLGVGSKQAGDPVSLGLFRLWRKLKNLEM